jgi:hypothetical protein
MTKSNERILNQLRKEIKEGKYQKKLKTKEDIIKELQREIKEKQEYNGPLIIKERLKNNPIPKFTKIKSSTSNNLLQLKTNPQIKNLLKNNEELEKEKNELLFNKIKEQNLTDKQRKEIKEKKEVLKDLLNNKEITKEEHETQEDLEKRKEIYKRINEVLDKTLGKFVGNGILTKKHFGISDLNTISNKIKDFFMENPIETGIKILKKFSKSNPEMKITTKGGNIIKKSYNFLKKIPNIIKEIPNRILSSIKGPRDDFPPHVRKFIKDHENDIIERIEICRTPLNSGIEKLLNVITLGTLNNKLYYDDIFHLYMIFTLNNKKYRMEKSEVIKIVNYDGNDSCIEVQMNNNITFGEMMNNAIKGVGDSIYHYNAVNNNCQIYIINLLKYSNLLTPELEEYILQDAKKILENTPSLSKKIINAITNLGERANILIEGKGKLSHNELINKISSFNGGKRLNRNQI